jgi:hypothetical protein
MRLAGPTCSAGPTHGPLDGPKHGLACRVRTDGRTFSFSDDFADRECAFPFHSPRKAALPRPARGRKRSHRVREGERGRRDSVMGKGGELWDDSALVDAFDRAMSTFKVCLLVSGFSDSPDRCLSPPQLLGFRVLGGFHRRLSDASVGRRGGCSGGFGLGDEELRLEIYVHSTPHLQNVCLHRANC